MSKRGDRELEAPGNWDYESAERRSPARPARVVVSVAFPRDDFEQVAKCAEIQGMRTSEFIRVAALDRATAHAGVTTFSWSGGTAGTFVVAAPLWPSTLVSAKVSQEDKESVTT